MQESKKENIINSRTVSEFFKDIMEVAVYDLALYEDCKKWYQHHPPKGMNLAAAPKAKSSVTPYAVTPSSNPSKSDARLTKSAGK